MTAGAALFFLDAILIACTWPAAAWLAVGRAEIADGWPQVLVLAVLALVFQYSLGLYRREAVANESTTMGRIPLIVAIAVATGSFVAMLAGWRLLPALYLMAVIWLVCCAILARLIFRALRSHAMFRPKLLIVGAGTRAWDLVCILRNQGRSINYDLTFVHEENFGAVDSRLAEMYPIERISNSGNLLEVAERTLADQIVVAPDERRGMALKSLITCRAAGFPVFHYMSFLEREVGRIDIKRLDYSWVLFSSGFDAGLVDLAMKRLLDLVVSLIILGLTFPVLLAAMFLVWAGDRGAVFYRQVRVTKGGRRFEILKLRSMSADAEKNGVVWAAVKDKRITPIGEFLRRTRIDELPQLLNVLRGDMSLVGPRPERPEFIENLLRELPLYQERHAVKAGLTGWAQVNYPYGASLDDARSKLSYDLYYVKNVNIFLDLSIILQTLRVVIWPGAGVR